MSCQSIVSLRMLGTTRYSTGLGMILFVSGMFAVSSGPLHGKYHISSVVVETNDHSILTFKFWNLFTTNWAQLVIYGKRDG